MNFISWGEKIARGAKRASAREANIACASEALIPLLQTIRTLMLWFCYFLGPTFGCVEGK